LVICWQQRVVVNMMYGKTMAAIIILIIEFVVR
jgi:hypothetical protein